MSADDARSDNAMDEDVAPTDAAPPSKLKFGLNLTAAAARKRKLSSVNTVQPASDGDRREAITAVGANGAVETVEKKAPLVIPLLNANGERMEVALPDAADDAALRAAAANALLAGDGNFSTASTSDARADVVVPMLVKNRMRGIEECTDDDEKFRYDIKHRPEAPTKDTYERMPVEMIGEAMLRGMGWTPGGGVGKQRTVFEPVTFVPRPGRTGLGVKIDEVLPPTHKGSKRGNGDTAANDENGERRRPIRQGESRDGPKILGVRNADGTFKSKRTASDKLIELRRRVLEAGALVGIVGGRHAGVHGRIEQMLPEQKASVRLASDALLTVAHKHLTLLDETTDAAAAAAAASSSSSSSSSSRKNKTQKKSKKRSAADEPSGGSKSKKRRRAAEIWMRPNIMVRIVSKKFKDGRYYSQKGRIVDCVGGEQCIVELTDGRVIENIMQPMLENVVGRKDQVVQILRGDSRNQFGKVLSRDAKSQKVLVQMDSDGRAYKFSYDDVALYVGASRDAM